MRAPEAPIGWPRATAPPRTFSFSCAIPRSRMQASATTANASLISNRSMSATVSPARSSALRIAATGAVVNHSGFWACDACETSRAIGHRTVLFERRLQAGHLLEVGLAGLFVAIDDRRALARDDLVGRDLGSEESALLRGARPGITLARKGILLLPGQLVLPGADFGAIAHVLVAVGIPQAVVHQGVDELAAPEPQAVANSCREIGRLTHALHAAGRDQRNVAAAQVVRRRHDGPHGGSTHFVEGDGAGRLRTAGTERRLPGWCLPDSGRQHTTHVDLL